MHAGNIHTKHKNTKIEKNYHQQKKGLQTCLEEPKVKNINIKNVFVFEYSLTHKSSPYIVLLVKSHLQQCTKNTFKSIFEDTHPNNSNYTTCILPTSFFPTEHKTINCFLQVFIHSPPVL